MDAANLTGSAITSHSTASRGRRCLLWHVPRIGYADALALQLDLHAQCADGLIPGALLLLEHDPVITMGVKTSSSNILLSPDALRARGIDLVATDRGGDVTYHGPGQLVGYPILRVKEFGGDLHRYLRLLEDSVIGCLARFGLEGRRHGPAGVWVGDRKVCSIGVAVRRWVAYHGFALNVDPDLANFHFINPCGLDPARVTSMAELLPSSPSMNDVRDAYIDSFARTFGVDLEPRREGPV